MARAQSLGGALCPGPSKPSSPCLEGETNPGSKAVVGGVAYPENHIVIDVGRTIAGKRQRDADSEVKVVSRGRGPRQNKIRKGESRIVTVCDRNGCIVGTVLVRPVEPSDRKKDAERRGIVYCASAPRKVRTVLTEELPNARSAPSAPSSLNASTPVCW